MKGIHKMSYECIVILLMIIQIVINIISQLDH